MKQSIKKVLVPLILLATVAAFIYYFRAHPETAQRLTAIPPSTVAVIIALYLGTICCLALINSATLRLCGVRMQRRESLLLTMYSSIVNFFGPLQSGPAVRAVYIKQKYKVSLAKYGLATIVYYAAFALLNAGLLAVAAFGAYGCLTLISVILLATLFVRRSGHARIMQLRNLDKTNLAFLTGATAVQIGLMIVIYFVELRAVQGGITLTQAAIYAAAANFSLFVSITPGAIGFRESFLVFSQKLHNIPNETIIVASTLDRTLYIMVLLALVVVIFGTHASKRIEAVTKK